MDKFIFAAFLSLCKPAISRWRIVYDLTVLTITPDKNI